MRIGWMAVAPALALWACSAGDEGAEATSDKTTNAAPTQQADVAAGQAMAAADAVDAPADAAEPQRSSAEILAESTAADWRALDPEETLYIDVEDGRVVVALSPRLAPGLVAQLRTLTKAGFYDGLSFYRVIEGFVAQGGDPFSAKDIGEAAPSLAAEFDAPLSDDLDIWIQPDADGYADQVGWLGTLPVGVDRAEGRVWHLHCVGAFAFGRNNEKDSASTEFYVTLQPQRYLDRNLTVAGRVISGMEHLQALRRVAPPQSEADDLGDPIVSMRFAADTPEAERSNFEVLDSSRPIFADYMAARRNRPEDFFYFRPNYIDICQAPTPVRPVAQD